MHSYNLRIAGMDCAGCAQTLERGVAQLPGVERCALNFTTERLHVSGSVSQAQIVQRVTDLGYQVVEDAPQPAEVPPSFLRFLWSRLETRLALLGALLILPGLVLHEILGQSAWWLDALGVAALLVAGLPVARSAWRAVSVARELNINVLMTIAAVGAVVIGAYTEAGMVMVLFALGEALEGYSSARARGTIRSLLEIVPETAVALAPAGEQRLPVAQIAVGARILVRPGERIPLDGSVVSGVSAVNQAAITGESQLVEKQPGAAVFAGSVNGEGALEVLVTHAAADTTIAQVVRLVAEAQERRAPVQRSIDRFAAIYTPAVVVVAALVAVLPPLLFGQPFWNPAPDVHGWLYRALALLVVACPCALVISTPVSVISALSAAARAGVLIKGGAALEQLARVQAVAFDKTGTLTAGQPQVVAVRSAACAAADPAAACAPCDNLLALANAVERRSEHPLAHAIVSAAAERGVAARYPAADAVTALVGRGVSGTVGGQTVLIGSHTSFDASVPHDPQHCQAAASDAALGYTPVMVSADGAYQGTISLADTVRPTSRAAVADLRALGLRSITMLTGDHPATAARIAQEVGVSEVRAGLLPADKVAAVRTLSAAHGSVAMVGDGVNDAPALAAASVGIAIGGAHGGSNQAMETADVTLLRDDLRQLPFVLRLSRAAMRTVQVNIAVSVLAKLVVLVLVLLGLGSMWLAVLADVGVALLVTLNGTRLLRWG